MKRNLYAILTGLFILAACQPGPRGQGQSTTAVPTLASTATPIPAPIRPDETPLNQMYSEDQILTITNGDFQKQEEQLADWWAYWQQADSHPFAYDVQPVFLYYWDESGKAGGVLIQPGGTYQSRSFYIPVSKDGFRTTPPTAEEGHTIPEGFGPLEISGGDKYVLDWRVNSLGQEGWVRLDENGEIAEVINPETGQWQPERFYILTPELKKGCEYNLIRPDHIEEDMGKLLEKERALGLTADDAFVLNNFKNFKQYVLNTPLANLYDFASTQTTDFEAYINSREIFTDRQISCSFMPTKDGHNIYIFGIPIRRVDDGYYLSRKDATWGWFHFGIDPVVHNLITWPDQENYFEDWEFYNLTQNPSVTTGTIRIPMMEKSILNDGSVQIDHYSYTGWDSRFKNIIDLIKKGQEKLGTIDNYYPGVKEEYFNTQHFMSAFVQFDHRNKDDFDSKYILPNLETMQKIIIPAYTIGFEE